MKCQRCRKYFPYRFYLPFFSSAGSLVLDPACAKAEIEDIHSVKNYEFGGDMAAEIYADYMKWKSKLVRDLVKEKG